MIKYIALDEMYPDPLETGCACRSNRERDTLPRQQTITVTVPREPSDAGIDPYLLLIDLERFDNVEEVDREG